MDARISTVKRLSSRRDGGSLKSRRFHWDGGGTPALWSQCARMREVEPLHIIHWVRRLEDRTAACRWKSSWNRADVLGELRHGNRSGVRGSKDEIIQQIQAAVFGHFFAVNRSGSAGGFGRRAASSSQSPSGGGTQGGDFVTGRTRDTSLVVSARRRGAASVLLLLQNGYPGCVRSVFPRVDLHLFFDGLGDVPRSEESGVPRVAHVFDQFSTFNGRVFRCGKVNHHNNVSLFRVRL